ncbi:sigma-54 dependent transcriptional regulator [bacterium]|nr:sigma-54 dependent transcriptional regulator [bacterium]
MTDRILIVDDEESSRLLCKMTLEGNDRKITLCKSAEEAIKELGRDAYDLVLTDMIMPGISGIELLERIKSERSDTSVLLMSGKGSISIAVKAIQSGAEDFIEKPFPDPEVLAATVKRVLKSRHLEKENRDLRLQLKKLQAGPLLIGGEAFSGVLKMVEKIAPLDTTVMITGQTGTGKEVIARRIHSLSERASKPFVALNCGGLPEGLLESLLFGHEKGAFTGAIKRTQGYFEKANGGTILLDEIGDMPLNLQIKMLRVLQEKVIRRVGGESDIPIDCRVIAATHRTLRDMVEQGEFREDLFYRLNVIHIEIPQLQQRQDDIPALATHFIRLAAAKMNKPVRLIEPEAMLQLTRYAWPGNIRELQNVLERAVALTSGDSIKSSDLSIEIREAKEQCYRPVEIQKFSDAKQEFERQFICAALERHDYNVSAAADDTGIPRQNFYVKMKKYGLQPATVKQLA